MEALTALESLLAADRDPARPLSVAAPSTSRQDVLSWRGWLEKVSAWRALLASRPERRWGLYEPDAGEFSAALFALISLSKTACLLANDQPNAIAAVSDKVDGFIGAIASHSVSNKPALPSSLVSQPAAEEDLSLVHIDSTLPLIEVFTSGSTGEPEVITKTLSQLGSELAHLHQLWGESILEAKAAGSCAPLVVATVSHQHIYGLLFRVLWPLAANWPFAATHCEYLEELSLYLKASPLGYKPALLLVSSPTHLSRLPLYIDSEVSRQMAAIFSSGAPLLRQDSLQIRARLAVGVNEVFGSSETGGIAWRQQEAASEARWTPLPGVNIRCAADGESTVDPEWAQCLQVQSSHLPDSSRWWQTTDRIALGENGCFELLGRVDRIAKVEGKRVSLEEMERCLLEHPLVDAVRLLTLEGRRMELGAVVAVAESAVANITDQDWRRASSRALRDFLATRFERPTLPRRWRYVETMPVNAQAKLPRARLLQLFQGKTDAALAINRDSNKASPNLPQLISRERLDQHELRLRLHMPEDLLYFQGHFDHVAILPGVVQVHWAHHFALEEFALALRFHSLEAIKFQQVILSKQEVTLELRYSPEKNKISFNYHSAAGKHSSGRIVMQADKL